MTRPTEIGLRETRRSEACGLSGLLSIFGCEAALISPRSLCRLCVQSTICVSHFGVDDVSSRLICIRVIL